MKITKGILRTYRTFNYDYQLKGSSVAENFLKLKKPWEPDSDFQSWRPWVEVPVSFPICCIVGANESGKSQFMAALQKLINRDSRNVTDRCRYSDNLRDDVFIGLELRDAIDIEEKIVSLSDWTVVENGLVDDLPNEQAEPELDTETLGSIEDIKIKSITLVGKNSSEYTVHIEAREGQYYKKILSPDDTTTIFELLPEVYWISSEVKLLSQCPISELLWYACREESDTELTEQDLTKLHQELGSMFPWPNLAAFNAVESSLQNKTVEDIRLIYRLLKHGAGYDFSRFVDLIGQDPGMRMSTSKDITDSVEDYLRLSRWWSQDVDVRIEVKVESDEVVFATTDRTETYYDIAERSRGFNNFLGYILQLIFIRTETPGPALILSDEPDFALSAVGQRNMLRLFREVTTDQKQLIYSTHSMELIDPNFPDRSTVIKKGQYDEGTLTVKEHHRGFYEPIRSALGSRILSVPFIEGPNLVVEGQTDQRFTVRTSQYLARTEKEYIDLASLSIVDADGCMKMNNVVKQAISVMGERAYLTILLDNDEKGNSTKVELEEQDSLLKTRKQIITISDIHGPGMHNKDTEIEDLIPADLYMLALKRELLEVGLDSFADNVDGDSEYEIEALQKPLVDCANSLLDRLQVDQSKYTLNKPSVVDHVFDILEEADDTSPWKSTFVDTLEKFTKVVGSKIHANARRLRHEGIAKLLRHLLKSHRRLRPEGATKGEVLELLENLSSIATELPHKDNFEQLIEKIKQENCDGDADDPIFEYANVIDRLFSLPDLLSLDYE